MSFGEKVLQLLSRKPDSSDYGSDSSEYRPDNALSLLERVYPDFLNY